MWMQNNQKLQEVCYNNKYHKFVHASMNNRFNRLQIEKLNCLFINVSNYHLFLPKQFFVERLVQNSIFRQFYDRKITLDKNIDVYWNQSSQMKDDHTIKSYWNVKAMLFKLIYIATKNNFSTNITISTKKCFLVR